MLRQLLSALFFLSLSFTFVALQTVEPMYRLEGSSAVFDFPQEGSDLSVGCQSCPRFYSREIGSRAGYFLLHLQQIIEIDQNGAECCHFACPFTGCDYHVLSPPFNFFRYNYTEGSDQINFEANVPNQAGYNKECKPTDTFEICANVQWKFQVQKKEEVIQLGENKTFALPADSLNSSLTISNWDFAPGSTGLKVKFMMRTFYADVDKWILQPGNIESPPYGYNGSVFSEVQMIDNNNRLGGVRFSPFALVDGELTEVEMTGPWKDGAGRLEVPFLRVFEVIVPRFNSEAKILFSPYARNSLTSDSVTVAPLMLFIAAAMAWLTLN